MLAARLPAEPNPQLRTAVNGVRAAAHMRDLPLRHFDVAVEMRGTVAQITIDASFANPTEETLEGDFRFTLPAGVVITGYALNVGRQMVDGVLVDHLRAKAVYDARVRGGSLVASGSAKLAFERVVDGFAAKVSGGAAALAGTLMSAASGRAE